MKNESKFWQLVLAVCAFIHFILGICMMFANLNKGMNVVINAFFLACSVFGMNYCCLIMYMLNIIIEFLTNINSLGLLVQNGSWNSIYSVGQGRLDSVLIIILTGFYLFVTVFSFYAYRHWKAQMQDLISDYQPLPVNDQERPPVASF